MLPVIDMRQLVIRELKPSPITDFRNEIRAPLDVKKLLKQAPFNLRSKDTDISVVIKSLVLELAEQHPKEVFDLELIESLLVAKGHDDQVDSLQRVIQAHSNDSSDIDKTWLVTYCEVEDLLKRHVGVVSLKKPLNLGNGMEKVTTIVLVIGPPAEIESKSVLETARSFATLLADPEVSQYVTSGRDQQMIKERILESSRTLKSLKIVVDDASENSSESDRSKSCCYPGKGIYNDFKRRWKHYYSDYMDGIKDVRTVSKVISSAIFLVFTILPTSIAYGMLNDDNTQGLINVQKVVAGQWIGGLIFGLIGGQQLLIISTTAPLSIYISVIYEICQKNGYDFYGMYGLVGIWSQIFLIIYALFQVADVMKYTKRSTEEIFGLFIACALTYEAVTAIVTTYISSYANCSVLNGTQTPTIEGGCSPSSSLLFLVLSLGTLWIADSLYSFRASHCLHRVIRELVADYALLIAVIIMGLISFFLFYNVDKPSFNIYDTPDFAVMSLAGLSSNAHWTAIYLAFPLSILFFMDQLLVTNTIDNKQHNLQKGSSRHWDLLVIALLNILLSIFGLPWMHGALPSAYLHLKALADVEERVHRGFRQTVIVKARETRLAVLLAHILMIPIYVYLIPYFNDYVPTAMFHGLFLFMAISSLTGNELLERVRLLFTEKRFYPSLGYLRSVPEFSIHLFTVFELVQLAILVVVGLYPHHYVQMTFPVVIALFIPFRLFILPMFFKRRYLEALDSEH